MKSLVLFSILAFTQIAAANSNTYTYADEAGKSGAFEVYDVPNTYGEEKLSWQEPEGKKYQLQFLSASSDSYETALSVSVNGQETLLDLNISLSFGVSFEQIKELMKQKDFRDTFSYLPEKCEESAVGFALVANNLNMEMKGYCLTK